MDIYSIKKYIYENNEIEHVLESLGCHNIEHSNDSEYYYAAMPDGDNPKGVCIHNNEYLNFNSYSRGIDYSEGKDIASLVMYIKKCDFVTAVKYLHEILGIKYEKYVKPKEKEKKHDPLDVFKKIIRRRKHVDVAEINELNEELVNDYIPILHIDWFREGIMPWAAEKFGICYSYRYNRIVIPLRHWKTGELLGFNQRTTVDGYKELGIKKYFITPSYKKGMNVYGVWENRESIESERICVVTESEKSVLKRYSRNDGTCVALQGKTITQEQRRIILGLNIVEVVVCLDKDADINEVRYICEQFYRIRKVSYIWDEWDILGSKDSPCDMHNKAYEFLFENRVEYNEAEHMKYLKSLKNN